MATLTRNLFWGQGETDHRLEVVEGHWPDDIEGAVIVVGPDKRRPEDHWFADHGLLERIELRPDDDGRIHVRHVRVNTPVNRLRRRLPWMFRNIRFLEVSPFGVSNLANTSVQPIADRLFVGFDAGRPIEVDPATLEYITPVGGNDEWFQALPGTLEPLVPVAAHPAADHDEGALYFVNYTQVSPPGVAAETHLARWDLEGPVHRWRVEGMSPFDSIHDVKVSEHHVVFSDLPFQFDPEEIVRGKPRTTRNQEHTNLWIVAKDDLTATPPGGTVRATEVQIPIPTGHLFVDHEEVDGTLRVILQHIPLADLMLMIDRESRTRDGRMIDPNYEGMVPLSVQPSVIGRYLIDPADGTVVESELAMDVDSDWGGVLATTDSFSPDARRHQRQLWYAGVGYDPDLLPQQWWDLYGDATDGIVAPSALPESPIPATLARYDLDSMKVAESWAYELGAFPSPPQFVPRRGATDPDDGYVVVVVHQDGPKQIQVFDAQHIERGPLARATSKTFNPNLMLHSCWMPDRVGPRPSSYRIGTWRDIKGAFAGVPGVVKSMIRFGRQMGDVMRDQKRQG